MEHLLEMKGIKMYFGGVHAVDGISTFVDEKKTLGIIGPNGSGKTTLINVLTGVYTATEGTTLFKGKDITRKKLQDMTSLGIARTFQNLRIFPALTALENVVVGEHIHIHTGIFPTLFHTKQYREQEKMAEEKAMEALKWVGLEKQVNEFAGSLPYGMQKRLELARALVCEPELLLLDEPTAGMNQVESQGLMELVKKIQAERGITIIMIEHNMKLMMRIADTILCMDAGKEIAYGLPVDVQNDPLVIKAYLGEE